GFAEAFDITYLDKEGKSQFVHQTSWGLSTRVMGGLIMVHGDNRGLVVPPRIAPTQAMIVPIAQHKEGVLDAAADIRNKLADVIWIDFDYSYKSTGGKFYEFEMKGCPVRIKSGQKNIEKNQVVLVRRDTNEKDFISLDELVDEVPAMLDVAQHNL